MADLPTAGAKLELDLSAWEANWSSAMDQAGELTSTIEDMSGTVDIDFNVEDAVLPFDDIPESTETEVNVTEDETSKGILDGINFLATIEKIKIAIDIVGTALNFIKDIGSMVVTPFLDVEDAVAKINAQTGGTGIADLGQFIRDIQAADLGESVDDISNVVIAAKQLGAPIDEATRASLTFTHTFQDQNPVTVMGTLKAVTDEFGVSMTTASDLMTVFFQQGGNKGGDALSTVDKYATAWHDMGLEIPQALSAVTSLMAGGVDTSDAASKMLLDFDNAMTTASADPSSQQAQMLKLMKIDNPKDAGQAIGAETIDGFASAFANLPADQQDLVSGLFFGKTGKLDTGAIAGMTTQSDMFKNVTDAAELAATEIDNSLRGAIDDFVLEINTSIASLLSSDSIDLPGKIAALKDGLQKGIAVLSEGGSIGDALEVALNIPGLSDTIDTALINIQRVFGQLVLALLDIVATIQDPLGLTENDAATRAQMKTMATAQLPFDIKVANPDELDAIFTQAARRGVTDLGGALNTALTELVDEGDFSKVQAILGAVLSDPTVDPADAKALSDKYTALIADATEAMKPPAQTDGWWQALKPPNDFLETALDPKDMGGKSTGAGWWTSFQPTADKTGDASTAFTDLQTHAETSMSAVSTAVTTANDESVASLEGLSLQAQLTDTDIATAMTGNTVTASFEAVALAAQASFPAVIAWFNRTSQASAVLDAQVSGHIGHLLGLLHDLQFLSAQVATGVQQALALGAGMGGGGGTTNNNNVVVNNNVNSTAAAAANGYAIAATLR